jgi:hypothetical protein
MKALDKNRKELKYHKWDEDLRPKEKLAIDSILCHSSTFSNTNRQ